MRGSVSMEANMDNIVSVKFDDREYFKIDTVLAYPVDTVGNDASLLRYSHRFGVGFNQQLKNNQ